jgi:hypothetical protein
LSDEAGDDLESVFGGDCAGDVSLIGLKAGGNLDVPQLPLELCNLLVSLGDKLSLLQDASFGCLELSVILLGAAVDGGDKSIGGGVDCVAQVFLLHKEVFGGFWG